MSKPAIAPEVLPPAILSLIALTRPVFVAASPVGARFALWLWQWSLVIALLFALLGVFHARGLVELSSEIDVLVITGISFCGFAHLLLKCSAITARCLMRCGRPTAGLEVQIEPRHLCAATARFGALLGAILLFK